MSLPQPRPRRVKPDDTVYQDSWIQLTRREAWTWTELAPVPYAFRSSSDRLNLGWSTTLSLAALKTGRVHLKAVLEPASGRDWAERRDAEARRVGSPARGWPDYLVRQQQVMAQRHATAKHVYLGTRLGERRLSMQKTPFADAEVKRWTRAAEDRLDLLRKGSLGPKRVTTDQMLRLRRHSYLSGLAPARPSATGRQWFGSGELVDELADIEITPLPRMVRVDTASGTRWHATFVFSHFPVEMDFPAVEPWLAWADRLPFPAEYDLLGELVPVKKAKRDVVRKLDLARDQKRDADRADADLPIEIAEMTRLAKTLEWEIPRRRLPLFYGWARLRVSSHDPADLANMFDEVQAHYAGIGPTGIDLTWPTGQAQELLLAEGVPAARPKFRSWRQRWLLETVACALPTAASGAGDPWGDYRGYTTGRHRQPVKIDLWAAIRGLSDRNKPAGTALVGNSGSGKSAALQSLAYGAAMAGITSVVIDPAGPLARLRDIPDLNGRVAVIDLLTAGGGVADPLGPHLIPLPPDPRLLRKEELPDADIAAYEAARAKVLGSRRTLTREILHGLCWQQLGQRPDSWTALLQAVETVGRSYNASTAKVVQTLLAGDEPSRFIGTHLEIALGDPEADFLSGQGGRIPSLRPGTTAVFTLPGVSLPEPGTPRAEWGPAEQLGHVALTLAAYMGRRLLWDLPNDMLKLLATDESYVLLESNGGRRLLRSALIDGRKRGTAVVVSVPNADMLLKYPELVDAFSTKGLFRTEGADALTSLLRLGDIEDTEDPRRQIRGFRDGESLLVSLTGVRDRFQWDKDVHPDLAKIINTTPTGAAWTAA